MGMKGYECPALKRLSEGKFVLSRVHPCGCKICNTPGRATQSPVEVKSGKLCWTQSWSIRSLGIPVHCSVPCAVAHQPNFTPMCVLACFDRRGWKFVKFTQIWSIRSLWRLCSCTSAQFHARVCLNLGNTGCFCSAIYCASKTSGIVV